MASSINIKGATLEDIDIESDSLRFRYETRPAEMVDDEGVLIQVFFAGGVMVASRIVLTDQGDSLSIFHFEVKERVRKKGVGLHSMMIVQEVAKWGDYSRIKGFIGGEEDTKEFLLSTGFTESGVNIDREQGVVHINQYVSELL